MPSKINTSAEWGSDESDLAWRLDLSPPLDELWNGGPPAGETFLIDDKPHSEILVPPKVSQHSIRQLVAVDHEEAEVDGLFRLLQMLDQSLQRSPFFPAILVHDVSIQVVVSFWQTPLGGVALLEDQLTGRITISNTFCYVALYTIKDKCKNRRFLQAKFESVTSEPSST